MFINTKVSRIPDISWVKILPSYFTIALLGEQRYPTENHSSTVVCASWQCHFRYETINNRCLTVGSLPHTWEYIHMQIDTSSYTFQTWLMQPAPIPALKFLPLVYKPILSLMEQNDRNKQFLWHQSEKDKNPVLSLVSNNPSFKLVSRLTLKVHH